MRTPIQTVREALSIVAVDNVRKQGGFAPFCAVLSHGKPEVTFTALEGDSTRPSFDAFTMVTFLRAKAAREQLLALGYAASAELDLEDGSVVSAIMLSVEDSSGESQQVIIPFAVKDGTHEFGDMVIRQQPTWAFNRKPWWKFW